MITAVLTDYSIKYLLSRTYNATYIGEIISILSCLSYFLAAIFNSGITTRIIKSGVEKILTVQPLLWSIISLIALVFPSLWMMSILFLINGINATTQGRQLSLNILPTTIRIRGQLILKSLISSLGVGLATFVVFVFAGKINLIIGLIFVINIFTLFYIKRVDVIYVQTLKKEIQLKRYTVADTITNQNINELKTVIDELLLSDNTDHIYFALSLLATTTLPEFPKSLLKQLHSKHAEVRNSIIELIINYNFIEALPLLKRRLISEINPNVKCMLYIAFGHFDPSIALEQARKDSESELSMVQAAALYILFNAGNLKDIDRARQILKSMVISRSNISRSNAAYILGKISTIDTEDELNELINDTDYTVSINSIEATMNQKMYLFDSLAKEKKLRELAPIVVDRLSKKNGIFKHELKIINKFGKILIPTLEAYITSNKKRKVITLYKPIRILALIEDNEAIKPLITLTQDEIVYVRNLAVKEIAYRFRKYIPSEKIKKVAMQSIVKEINNIIQLNALSGKFDKNYFINEVNSRKYFAKKRLLYWLSIHSGREEIISLMPILLSKNANEIPLAIELLTSVININQLSEIIIQIFLSKTITANLLKEFESTNYTDKWLDMIINHLNNINMENAMDKNIQKVFILRSTELFRNLSAETLIIIAEDLKNIDMSKGQIIFKQGDPPNGLYIVMSGEVELTKNNSMIASIKQNGFFGELALLDNETRTASAIAKSEGELLYLEQEVFNQIVDDQPEVLRSITGVVLRYYREHLKKEE